jgi:hypothetical protein
LAASVQAEIKKIGSEFDYRVVFDPDAADVSLKAGVAAARKRFCWKSDFLIVAPANEHGAFAYSVHDEFINLHTRGEKPLFFDFLKRLESCLQASGLKTFHICFSSDWGEKEYVRFTKGSLADLIKQLESVCGWWLRLYHPFTGHYLGESEYPLIFEVELE